MRIQGKRNAFAKEMHENLAGYLFVIPFLFGFIFLFAIPLFQSIVYCFSDVQIGKETIVVHYAGLKNIKRLVEDISFLTVLKDSVVQFIWKIPVTVLFAVFMALLLKGKFAGRLFFRMMLFLPVIFASDVVMGIIQKGGTFSLSTSDNMFMISTSSDDLLKQLMASFGFQQDFITSFVYYVNNIFEIVWQSGIQIILFILGLENIPVQLYEVSKMEGATGWETFWKITFPLLSPTILLCTIYTVIATFMESSNTVMTVIYESMQMGVSYACTQSLCYSLVTFLLIGIVYFVLSRRTVYLD